MTVTIQEFKTAYLAGARVYDTRPKTLFDHDGLSRAEHLSLEAVQAGQLPALAKDEPLYLICERGQISDLVRLYLVEAGFKAVHNVAGGMIAWRLINTTQACGN